MWQASRRWLFDCHQDWLPPYRYHVLTDYGRRPKLSPNPNETSHLGGGDVGDARALPYNDHREVLLLPDSLNLLGRAGCSNATRNEHDEYFSSLATRPASLAASPLRPSTCCSD